MFCLRHYLKSEVQPIHTMNNMHRRLCYQRVVTYILSIEAFATRIGVQRTKCSHTSLVSEKLVDVIYSEFVLIP